MGKNKNKKTFKNKKFKRSYKKYKKNKNKFSPSFIINRSPTYFPDMYYTKLKYVQYIAFTPSAGLTTNHFFRGNSLYDPDFTGTGHQPLGYDQISNIYREVLVKGCLIHIEAMCNTANDSAYIGLVPTDVTTAITIQNLSEEPRAVTKSIQQGSGKLVLKKYMTTQKEFGLSKLGTQDDAFTHDAANNPISIWYWAIAVCDVNALNSPLIQMKITLTYDCVFFDRIEPGQS